MAGKYPADLLVKLTHQLKVATEFADQTAAPAESLLTAADLARVFGVNHEMMKRSLKFLKDLGVIRAIGMSPKRYRFDSYGFRELLQQEDHLSEPEKAYLDCLKTESL